MVSACLPWYLLKGPVKRDFLEIYVTPFFGLRRFKNSSAMRVSFFLRISELNQNLQKAEKIEKIFFVCEINTSENFAINCLY